MLPLCREHATLDVPYTAFGVNNEATNVRTIILVVVFLVSLAPCLAVAAPQAASSEQSRAAAVEMMMQFATFYHCNSDCLGLVFSGQVDRVEVAYPLEFQDESFSRAALSETRRRLELLGLTIAEPTGSKGSPLSIVVSMTGSDSSSTSPPSRCEVKIPEDLLASLRTPDDRVAQDFAVNLALNCVMSRFGYAEYRAVIRDMDDFFFRAYLRAISSLQSHAVSFEQFRLALDAALQ